MSESQRRKQQFFNEHPTCCFCGGVQPIQTIDHQPARNFFYDRAWPEGFEFPACDQCNQVSKDAEQAVSFISLGGADLEKYDHKKFSGSLNWIRRNKPDLLTGVIPSTRERRNTLRNKGITKPTGYTYRDMKMVSLGGPIWGDSFSMFGRKMFLALHYMTFRVPLSLNGGLWLYIHTNLDVISDAIPTELLEITQRFVAPRRGNQSLLDQMQLRWDADESTKTAAFILSMHKMLVFTGITTEYPDLISLGTDDEPLRPFSWGNLSA